MLVKYFYTLLSEKLLTNGQPYLIIQKCLESFYSDKLNPKNVSICVIVLKILENLGESGCNLLRKFDHSQILTLLNVQRDLRLQLQSKNVSLTVLDLITGLTLNICNAFINTDKERTSTKEIQFNNSAILEHFVNEPNIDIFRTCLQAHRDAEKTLTLKIQKVFVRNSASLKDIYSQNFWPQATPAQEHDPDFLIMKEISLKCFINNFLVVYGPECSGKTYFINRVLKYGLPTTTPNTETNQIQSNYLSQLPQVLTSKILSKKTIRIYLDENTDIKSLMGNYICTEKIGDFKWVDGPITSCYKNGHILLLENLHLANQDVINLFYQMSLGVFYLQGKYLELGNGFLIIATWTLDDKKMMSENKLADLKSMFGENATNFVRIQEETILGFEELVKIHFPQISDCKVMHEFVVRIYREIMRIEGLRTRKFIMNTRKLMYF
jgi:hypothetical protein